MAQKKLPPHIPEVDEEAGILDDLHAWYLS